jgi:tetratricopeptide (TPR) repeat protein
MTKHQALNWGLIGAGVVLLMFSSYALGTNLAPWKNDRALWTRATQVNKNSAMAHFNLGIHLENKGSLDQAETQYALAASLERDRAIFHFRLALMMAERRANQEARNHFLKAAALRPNDPMMLYEAARIEAAMGDPRHSLRLLTRALRLVDHGEALGGGLKRGDLTFERTRVLRQLESEVLLKAPPNEDGKPEEENSVKPSLPSIPVLN